MSNTERIIDKLISLEAWHKPLEHECAKPLYVALSFSDARYSGGLQMPVEFTVRLKRAQLVVVCDPGIDIPKSTKVRVYPARQRSYKTISQSERTDTETQEFNRAAEATVSLNPSVKAVNDLRNSETKGGRSGEVFEVAEDISQTVYMTYGGNRNEHLWNCHPNHEKYLHGIGHDGSSHLMEIKAIKESRIEDLGVRVFLKCLADDIDIADITIKPSFAEKYLGKKSGKKDIERRLRLAREVIQEKLREAQLEVVELEPRFQEVILADVVAVPEC
ncbi:hypothetical protein HJ526_05255 [Donghicola sp. C2-DW-16]|uniref:Uncharacterized protein n=1 Tax=Donghicola mangrovi TaxID=2729614 RepID=A0ABX2PBF9_9RHOB|nr:hypothetical protein [Donghicola mangrovi]NVO26816.1 hypothetical protein [Donghicola mangrovi]